MNSDTSGALSVKTLALAFAAFAFAFVVTAAASTPLSATGVWMLSTAFGLLAVLVVLTYKYRGDES